VANKKKPSEDDRIHGRSREVKHVVNQMSDVDFFDYRLVVRSSGIQELMMGHTGLRQGLVYVESLVEETRAGNYSVAYAQLLRSLQIFEESYNQIRRALVDLGEYYDDHPIEVREINYGLTEMCDGCDNLVKSVVALKQTKTGESLEMSKRALTHLREAAHRIGSHLRDIKDCCPSNIEFEVLDIRENEARIARELQGAKPVEMVSCHTTHAPGEPCDQKPDNSAVPSNHDEETAQLAQQLKEHQVSLEKITQSLETEADTSIAKTVAHFARSMDDESAMEDLMRKVSENRARTIDKLVADARAAKAEAIANTLYVPMPGEEVPGMRPMNAKFEPVQEKSGSNKTENTVQKSGAKKVEKVLEKALEKAKDTAKKRPAKGSKSETRLPAAAKSVKAKLEEEVGELTFDDGDLDFNKAAKKKAP